MRCEYCTDKIQTGLRIPSKRYEELQNISQEIGVESDLSRVFFTQKHV